ncbi:Flp family type IVb pilin [Burkholderia multivorans]|uniref:Flp family type IVb pilin n=1 Tax=Burkholderia multivorans TaxID=87883 RepID=A0A2S9LP05_9BURK|nr:Flp family type IVb pilin [Burkholderia multivorans]MBJ9614363.1 Flp family type IVb pilin [Burkholderia multivorans]MBU9142979.1 Flp family type IVb pilin [Burkholderia multivorans]MBU9312006.1 Flp family type IVb pilin [Burkholderia multivorans]MBU9328309.1 Flp family type IVb pilin [Burkholderia multivorans]MBU9375429.1 Flp family type IVb pilin [Burkholderia multivorans]
MKAIIKRFLKEETGVTAIEYGLIAGLISVVILASVSSIGTGLEGMFQKIALCVSPASGATAQCSP